MVKEMIDLDTAVINALELFIKNPLPELNLGNFKNTLVVGSGNAASTGKIIMNDKKAVFADESNYLKKLKINKPDGALLVSSSGQKHAPIIAKELKKRKIPTILITNNPNPSAKKFISKDKFFVFPKNPEPYTYNTSTYLGMIFSKTKEDPKKILNFIKKLDKKIPKNLKKYDAFFFIIPEKFEDAKDMFLVKFDELFGPKLSLRCFTPEQTKHAKTIVKSDKELFIDFGIKNKNFGTKKSYIPLQKNADFGAFIAVAYYIIGKIQKQNPQWFKQNIEQYCKKISKIFGDKITPIVE